MNTPRRFLGNALHRFLCSPLRFLISTSAHLSKMVLHVTLAAFFSISPILAQVVVRFTKFTLFTVSTRRVKSGFFPLYLTACTEVSISPSIFFS